LRGEIVTVGNELICGLVTDTNSPYIAERLMSLGVEPLFITSVGDDEWAIEDALLRAIGRAEVVIVTGGLGPTPDDITSRAAAKSMGKRLMLSPEALEHIKKRYKRWGINPDSRAERQALIPQGARIIINPVGTAPGFYMSHKGKHLFFIPGVPKEMKVIMDQGVLPIIADEIPQDVFSARKVLKIFGLTESQVYEKVKDVRYDTERVKLGFLPVFPENHLSVTVRTNSSVADAQKILDHVEESMRDALGDAVFGEDEDTLEKVVARLLKSKEKTIAVAESLTGGLLAERLTNIPGSSNYFERGIVTYSDESKVSLLGVDKKLISDFGAVSAQVAEAMAIGIKRISGTDIGVSTTGIAGPGGGSDNKPVGTVFIALAYDDGGKVSVRSHRYGFFGDRDRIRQISSEMGLEWIRRYLMDEGEKENVN
jgi:nicotinamide-nucleotide amidase